MDILRRAAGARRSSRWWDRGQYFSLLIVAAICAVLGGWASVDQVQGRPESGQVMSCRTERPLDRLPGSTTTCEVVSAGRTVEVQTARRHPAGSGIGLRRTGGSVFDPEHNGDEVWWLPAGLVVALVAWWAGLPPRTDLAYGRHAALRARGPRP